MNQLIIYDPKTNKLYGYNGSGRSSMNFIFAEMLNISREITGTQYIPSRGPLVITVPGVVQGWCDIYMIDLVIYPGMNYFNLQLNKLVMDLL